MTRTLGSLWITFFNNRGQKNGHIDHILTLFNIDDSGTIKAILPHKISYFLFILRNKRFFVLSFTSICNAQVRKNNICANDIQICYVLTAELQRIGLYSQSFIPFFYKFVMLYLKIQYGSTPSFFSCSCHRQCATSY